MLKLLTAFAALTIIASACAAQGPPPGFRNPQDTQPPPPPVIFEKHCINCNRVVSNDSKSGDTCPFCGTKWVYDESTRNSNPKAVNPKTANKKKTAEETPDTSIEKTIGRYAIVFAGLAVSALIVTLTIRFIMNNI
jgi:hypothetical protein